MCSLICEMQSQKMRKIDKILTNISSKNCKTLMKGYRGMDQVNKKEVNMNYLFNLFFLIETIEYFFY